MLALNVSVKKIFQLYILSLCYICWIIKNVLFRLCCVWFYCMEILDVLFVCDPRCLWLVPCSCLHAGFFKRSSSVIEGPSSLPVWKVQLKSHFAWGMRGHWKTPTENIVMSGNQLACQCHEALIIAQL